MYFNAVGRHKSKVCIIDDVYGKKTAWYTDLGWVVVVKIVTWHNGRCSRLHLASFRLRSYFPQPFHLFPSSGHCNMTATTVRSRRTRAGAYTGAAVAMSLF
jgi:hypothetical protein